ncbi:MAG: hypothetical protein P4N60_12180 [Verrucomicrobiae bacterium]|nr:hypothetical protein [Verrucomicrobiae bacterium]
MSGALTNITASVTGKTLTITWPADQLGWILQAQTNHSDSGQWFDLPCSSNASSVPTVMDSAAPAVFYRLSQS